MFKRFFRWLKAVFNRGMDKLEDPELMLDQAQREMREVLAQNREKAVQAITQRNRLQQLYDQQLAQTQQLEKQAEMALKQGKRDLALGFVREKQDIDAGLEGLKASLDQATLTVEQVKVAIKRQEEEVKKKYTQALALKAQWKNAQIQNSISKALDGLTFENEYEGSFSAARDRIHDKMAEASARQEMFAGSVAGKTMEMQDLAKDSAADEELAKMEARLGLGQPAVEAATTPEVKVSSGDAQAAEDALSALEKRISGDSGTS